MKTKQNNNRKIRSSARRDSPTLALSNFVPVPPYHIVLRFICEPGTDCTTLTGMNPKNLGLSVGVALLNVSEYLIPANGVLAVTAVSAIPFRYMRVHKAHVWGPSAGNVRVVLNATATSLVFPRPTKIAESQSVVNKPYDCISSTPQNPIILRTSTSDISEVFSINFTKGSVAGSDNTVILQVDCTCFS